MGSRTYLGMQKFAEIYGEIFYVNLAGMKAIILNSPEAVKECFQQNGDLFSGRPRVAEFDRLTRKYVYNITIQIIMY